MVRPDSAIAVALAVASVACDAPPRGEALVVVDTDMPVPKIVDHLRVDVYSADGSQWFVSRDIYAPDAKRWPLSFSVYTDDTSSGASALVRLRAYRSGYVQDYRGEGPITLPPIGSSWTSTTYAQCCDSTCASLCPQYWQPTTGCDHPPCLSGGATPATEPQPLVTIDRVVRVDLVPGVRGKASVVLAGACAGQPASLPDPARETPSPNDIQTCVDTERTLVPVTSTPLDPDMSLPAPSSLVGHFEDPFKTPCEKAHAETGLFDEEICIEGGVMILGDNANVASEGDVRAVPRIAAVPSFLIDKYEFSVGRLTDALAHGFKGGTIAPNNGPVNDPKVGVSTTCTAYNDPSWSSTARDKLALNCLDAAAARALCKFQGGDLPTEAQWEFAATMAGRPDKSFVTFPLPGPQCIDVSFARLTTVNHPEMCFSLGYGVGPVDYGKDIAPSGVVGLTGNVHERVLDAASTMSSNCWLSAPIESPSCSIDAPASGIARGSSWSQLIDFTTTARRLGESIAGQTYDIGFRCAR